MKLLRQLAITPAVLIVFLFACNKDAREADLKTTEKELSEKAQVPSAICNPNAYVVTLESKTLVGNNWVWIWSVRNPNPGNGSNGTTQDLSHWGMQFGTCFAWADVVGAGYSMNGNNWTSFTPNYETDPSQGCLTTPVLKFDVGTNGTAKTYYKLILSKNYQVNPTALAYYKSGSRTACCTFPFSGVGCLGVINTKASN